MLGQLETRPDGALSDHVVVDQIRAVDKVRLVRRLGQLSPSVMSQVLAVAREMFAE